jgi:hypothetical protein
MTDQQWTDLCKKITEFSCSHLQELTPEEEVEFQARANRIRLPLERLRSAAAELEVAANEAFWATRSLPSKRTRAGDRKHRKPLLSDEGRGFAAKE